MTKTHKFLIALAFIIIPTTAFAVSQVYSVNGFDSTIVCPVPTGHAKCEVNTLSNFMFGSPYFGIDSGNAIQINPSILWLTNDMPMFTFGDGENGPMNLMWNSTDREITLKDGNGIDVPVRFNNVLKSPDGTCWTPSINNYGVVSYTSSTCY